MQLTDPNTLNKLYRYCYALCNNESDAYDLLHSSIEKYLATERHQQTENISYIKTIIRNTHIDQLRRNNIVQFEQYNEESSNIETQEASLDSLIMTSEQLELCWQKLSELEREILFFWAIEGYSTQEIADQLDKPRGTILSVIHRLRKRLQNYGQADEQAGAS